MRKSTEERKYETFIKECFHSPKESSYQPSKGELIEGEKEILELWKEYSVEILNVGEGQKGEVIKSDAGAVGKSKCRGRRTSKFS